ELRMLLLYPFETSFGTTQERHVVLLKISDGRQTGYGEVTAAEGPFYSYETWETAWHVLRDYIIPSVLGKEVEQAGHVRAMFHGIRGHNMAKAGLETAFWDLQAKIKNVPLWKMLGGTRERVSCGVSIGIQASIDKLLGKIAAEMNAGYRRFKIKIKPGWDVEVIREVRAAFPKILLMGDANSAYTRAGVVWRDARIGYWTRSQRGAFKLGEFFLTRRRFSQQPLLGRRHYRASSRSFCGRPDHTAERARDRICSERKSH